MNLKSCSRCHTLKPPSEFFKSGKQKSGLPKFRGDCRDCAKKDTANWRIKNRSHYNNYAAMWRAKNPDKQHANEIKRNYGLSADSYQKMLTKQNNGCAICEKPHQPGRKKGRLFVDHCHSTNKIRGLLCLGCNAALGYVNDDISRLKKAIRYLQS